MSVSEQRIPIKRSLSEELDVVLPPTKISSAQVKLNGKAWTKHPLHYYEDGSLTILVYSYLYLVVDRAEHPSRSVIPRIASKGLFSLDSLRTGGIA